MAKSLFLLPSSNPAFNHAQARKLRDELGSKALTCEGPFSDRHDGVKKLRRHVMSHSCKRVQSRLDGVLGTLGPQNLPECLRMADSKLRMPFVYGDAPPDISKPRDCAGMIACTDPVEHERKKVRVADFEELTMLGVALLRSFGIQSHFSVITLDNERIGIPEDHPLSEILLARRPCILLPGNDQMALGMFIPPFYSEYTEDTPIKYVEVLDSDALGAFLKIRHAKAYANDLMEIVSSRKPEFQNEGMLRAIQIGHLLYEGKSQWTLTEAQQSIMLAQEMFGPNRTEGISSLRQQAEEEYAHNIECLLCHLSEAINEILCDRAKISLMENMHEPSYENLVSAARTIPGHSCVARFLTYMLLASEMNNHIHPPSECEKGRGEN